MGDTLNAGKKNKRRSVVSVSGREVVREEGEGEKERVVDVGNVEHDSEGEQVAVAKRDIRGPGDRHGGGLGETWYNNQLKGNIKAESHHSEMGTNRCYQ